MTSNVQSYLIKFYFNKIELQKLVYTNHLIDKKCKKLFQKQNYKELFQKENYY